MKYLELVGDIRTIFETEVESISIENLDFDAINAKTK